MLWDFFKHKIRYRDSELSFTTVDEANEMQKLYEAGWKQIEIANKIGTSVSVVSNVLRGNRKVSVAEKRLLSLSNTSGTKNVYWDKSRNKWRVSFKTDGKNVMVGRFESKEEAIEVADNYRSSV
jgi:transcriptional regulator with XRE-family HTH domain